MNSQKKANKTKRPKQKQPTTTKRKENGMASNFCSSKYVSDYIVSPNFSCSLPEHLSSPPGVSGVRVTRSLVLCVCFVDVSPFVLFLFVLSVVLRFTDSDFSLVS